MGAARPVLLQPPQASAPPLRSATFLFGVTSLPVFSARPGAARPGVQGGGVPPNTLRGAAWKAGAAAGRVLHYGELRGGAWGLLPPSRLEAKFSAAWPGRDAARESVWGVGAGNIVPQ